MHGFQSEESRTSESSSEWPAYLHLHVGRRQGRTLLLRRRHQGPFLVQKPLYPEGDSPCHLILLHPPGGMAAGDSLALDLQMEPESHLLLTTPGAGKWYRAEQGVSRQQLYFHLDKQAIVEWLPQENIFFSGCQAELQMQVDLSAQALFLAMDLQQLGRLASGEPFATGKIAMKSAITQEGRALWREQGALVAGSSWLQAEAGMAGMRVCGSLLLAGAVISDGLLQSCRELPTPEGCRCGITRLPNLLHARILAPEIERARLWLRLLWQQIRPQALHKPAVLPRIWHT
ncbi:urease accessory protein UreD [Candidatus Magnetaquicoccus inordinatus]|uniref:urease accessory protein UreD n=1 Tax=Candidatus Magnetaquicoccus inordinatus TaxID=2496818 RepID=UPI00187D35C6|nr:urease accessory protein UreD [Candidatus Magnetaquicoccus inordinatus]